MTSASLIPLASVTLINNSGVGQVLTDSITIPSLSFSRSASDLIASSSFTIPAAYDIPLSPPQTLAIEYEGVVRFHGVVTDCSISWSEGIPSTSIGASDFSYLLSHHLVPILTADWQAVTGMVGPCDFGTLTAGGIVQALCGLCGITAGDLITDSTSDIHSFAVGTTCLDAIMQLAESLGYTFFLYFTKETGVYYTKPFFGPFAEVDAAGVL